MKRWLLVFSALTLLGLPGTLFLANLLEVSNEVHITATVEDPNAAPSDSSAVVSNSSGQGGGSGASSNQSSSTNEDEEDGSNQSEEGSSGQTQGSQAGESESNDTISETPSTDSTDAEELEEPMATLYFGGYAFPNASVQFSIDGTHVSTLTADEDGYFEGSYSELVFGGHIFSFQAESYAGDESRLVSYSYTVQNESPIYISSILLPPIFTPADSGEGLAGVAIPGAEIEVYGVEQNGSGLVLLETIHVPDDGAYSYEVDLKTKAYDQYYVACTFKGQACGYSGIIQVQNIGANNAVPTNVFADFTNDVEVNFVDFSFMRAAFLSDVSILFYDLDEDGALTIKDFSLLNYQWTQ